MLLGMPKKDLDLSDLTAVTDTREQNPLSLSPLKVVTDSLITGDYSVRGLENVITVERKSLQDLVMCVGRERKRFDREIHRMLAYPARLLVIEATLGQIELKQYRGEVAPMSIIGSVMGWMASGIPVLFSGSHEEAGKLVARFLYISARRRWREAQTFCETLRVVS